MRTDHSSPAAERLFVNYFEVGFNQQELLLNMGQLYEDDAEPSLPAQLTTTPAYARKLFRLLELTLCRYESQYGPITES